MSEGITFLGAVAEEKFRDQTGAEKPHENFEGDAILRGHPVEIKKANGGTVNQVRPARYTTLAIYIEREDTWFVIPPHEVVKLATLRSRGQHTENPFECMALTVKHLPSRFKLVRPTPQQLLARALSAIAEGEEHIDVKNKMATVIGECSRMAAKHLTQVRRLLGS